MPHSLRNLYTRSLDSEKTNNNDVLLFSLTNTGFGTRAYIGDGYWWTASQIIPIKRQIIEELMCVCPLKAAAPEMILMLLKTRRRNYIEWFFTLVRSVCERIIKKKWLKKWNWKVKMTWLYCIVRRIEKRHVMSGHEEKRVLDC